MERALDLARRALGRTSPNPAVGAVVVKDGRVVGEGHTCPPGGAHAEIVALAEAGAEAAGGTLYVTLEPCCHHGRTPPCTKAILESGVAEVVVATKDPNPLVNGRGCAELLAAGVRVRIGEREAEAKEVSEAFAKYITTGKPFVTLKWAMTLDGKIACASGDSRWVTGEQARLWVHRLRAMSDAILVGAGTVTADDPELTVRLPGGAGIATPVSQPLRVVVSARGQLPLTARLFSPPLAPGTLVATSGLSDPAWREALAALGVAVAVLPDRDGLVDLAALLRVLAARGLIAVVVEGGAGLNAAFLEAGLADKVHAFVAPKVVGGEVAPSPVAGRGRARMDEAIRLERLSVQQLAADVLLSGYVVPDGTTAAAKE